MTENEYLELPWSVEDTIENLEAIKEIMIEKVRAVNLDGKAKSDVEEIEFDFCRALSALREIQQYRAIGTVEECLEARERQREKKPIKDEYNHDCCPNCGWIVYQDEWGGRYLPHCENCGQAILWEEEQCQ